jgi:hypothetical protein
MSTILIIHSINSDFRRGRRILCARSLWDCGARRCPGGCFDRPYSALASRRDRHIRAASVTHGDTGIASAVRADAARLAPHARERVARAGRPSNGTRRRVAPTTIGWALRRRSGSASHVMAARASRPLALFAWQCDDATASVAIEISLAHAARGLRISLRIPDVPGLASSGSVDQQGS